MAPYTPRCVHVDCVSSRQVPSGWQHAPDGGSQIPAVHVLPAPLYSPLDFSHDDGSAMLHWSVPPGPPGWQHAPGATKAHA